MIRSGNPLGLAALITALALALPAHAPAQSAFPPPGPVPFEPILTDSRAPALCRQFLSHWTGVHFGGRDGRTAPDLSQSFPDAEFLEFRSDTSPTTTPLNLYNDAYYSLVDLDRDGTREVLHLESSDRGWRHLGANLYLFDTIAAYAGAARSEDHKVPYHNYPLLDRGPPLPDPPRHLMRYGASDDIRVFRIGNALYTISQVAAPSAFRADPTEIGLFRLYPGASTERLCKVQLLPPLASLDDFAARSPFFQAITALSGVPGQNQSHCPPGTANWHPPHPRQHLLTIFHQPWKMEDLRFRRRIPARPQDDAAREIRLLVWGTSDPTSWHTYLRLKSARSRFLSEMTAYYRLYLGYPDEEASQLADTAHRFLIDNVAFYWYPDDWHLTRVAGLEGARLDLSPASEPAEIARDAIREWERLSGEAGLTAHSSPGSPLEDAVLAAIYTGLDTDTITRLLERLDAAAAEMLANAETLRGWERAKRRAAGLRISLLTASLGDPERLAAALEIVGDPDIPTNGFGKTALMYAAQQNNAAALDILLAAGADPNIATEARDGSCLHLDRDARTALMYAAENADPSLIRRLLEAGADPHARDSRGNWVLWYLYRNPGLTDADKAALRDLVIIRE